MGFTALSEIVGGTCKNGKYRTPDNKIGFATDNMSRPSGKGVYAMRITIPQAVAKEARFIRGDRVEILLDKEARLVLIKRVNSGGWRLCASHPQATTLTVKITWRPGMPSVAESCHCNYTIDEGGVLFELPDDVSFDENLRVKAAS